MTPVYAQVEYAFVRQLWPKWDGLYRNRDVFFWHAESWVQYRGKGDAHQRSAWIKHEGLCGAIKPHHWMSFEWKDHVREPTSSSQFQNATRIGHVRAGLGHCQCPAEEASVAGAMHQCNRCTGEDQRRPGSSETIVDVDIRLRWLSKNWYESSMIYDE